MALIEGLEWGVIPVAEAERVWTSPCSMHRVPVPHCRRCQLRMPTSEWRNPPCDYDRDCPFPPKFWIQPTTEDPADPWSKWGTCMTHFLPMVERIHEAIGWVG